MNIELKKKKTFLLKRAEGVSLTVWLKSGYQELLLQIEDTNIINFI